MAESEDRTQAPSERRLLRAREEGQAPISREVVTAAGLAGAALLLAMFGSPLYMAFASSLRDMLAAPEMTPGAALRRAGLVWATAALPLCAAVGVFGAGAVLAQSGLLLHAGALLPDPARLDPRRGLKRLFGLTNSVETGKAIIKFGLLAWAVWTVLSRLRGSLQAAPLWTAPTLAGQIGASLVRLLFVVVAIQACIGVLDMAWTRWRFTTRMRMSREETKQEQRESEGDPRIKARFRQLRQLRSKQRMLAAVAKATVVITNPTHYAVALAYQRGGKGAPRVVAKGADEVAARIREAATDARIPLVSNPPLARALFPVPLDAEIPAEHFAIVAEVIAYVWRLRELRR